MKAASSSASTSTCSVSVSSRAASGSRPSCRRRRRRSSPSPTSSTKSSPKRSPPRRPSTSPCDPARPLPLRQGAGCLRLQLPALPRQEAGPDARHVPLHRAWRESGDPRPPGVGKTHLAIGLGLTAIERGYGVLFTTAAALITSLTRAVAEGRLDDRLKVYTTPRLLIIDEIGYLPIDRAGANLFFQLISRRYERGAMIRATRASAAGGRSSATGSSPRPPWTASSITPSP